MGRRAKPAKAKTEVHDLERRLAEALEQRAALSEILRVISSSPTDDRFPHARALARTMGYRKSRSSRPSPTRPVIAIERRGE